MICPECGCYLYPEIIDDVAYMSCVNCGWNRKMIPSEFIELPMDIRKRILTKQASDPEIIKYYEGLDIDE